MTPRHWAHRLAHLKVSAASNPNKNPSPCSSLHPPTDSDEAPPMVQSLSNNFTSSVRVLFIPEFSKTCRLFLSSHLPSDIDNLLDGRNWRRRTNTANLAVCGDQRSRWRALGICVRQDDEQADIVLLAAYTVAGAGHGQYDRALHRYSSCPGDLQEAGLVVVRAIEKGEIEWEAELRNGRGVLKKLRRGGGGGGGGGSESDA